MAAVFVDAVAGKTTTTGTGAYTITADVPGYRDFRQIADGVQVVCVVRSATDLEVGLYTKGGGISPTLTRTTIYINLAGTGAAVSWPGGEKDVRTTLSSTILPATNFSNVWTANQLMRTARIAFGGNDASYFYSDIDNQIVGVLNSQEFLRILDGSPPSMRLRWTDPGTGAGPTLRLDRNSSTPATNDFLGQIMFDGRDSGGGNQTYVKLQAYTQAVLSGSEGGALNITVPVTGTDEVIMSFSGQDIIAMPGINNPGRVLMCGKTSQGLNNTGAEIVSTGHLVATTDNSTCISANRKNGFGGLVVFYRDAVQVGAIFVDAAGVIAYQTFIGSHVTTTDYSSDGLRLGMLLSTIDEYFDPGRKHLPRVKVTDALGCKRVYGVYGGPTEESYPGSITAHSLGAYQVLTKGECKGGDLLWSSAEPGIAEVQPDDIVRAHTIGKVTIGDNSTDIRLVPATLCCG